MSHGSSARENSGSGWTPVTLEAGALARDFVVHVIRKAHEDNIFFMAGAITFNVLVGILPLILLTVGIAGFVLNARLEDPASVVLLFLRNELPQIGGDVDLVATVQRVIAGVIAERAGVSVVGGVIFLWIATRLIGTLRVVLREVFDISRDRGIIWGKLFDAQIVLVAGILLVVNFGITLGLGALRDVSFDLLGLERSRLDSLQRLSAQLLALASIWVMFLLVYRYVPARRIPWRMATVASTFTAVLFEVAKLAFSAYATHVANFRSVYGNLTTAIVLFFWLYYGAIIFVLGGEVAQVYDMFRKRRQRYERPLMNPTG